METDQHRTLKTTEMSLRIVDLLGEREEATVSGVADALYKPTSTVHGHLVIL
jgi:DNA-binding IclR family transcriptional regulator